MRKLVITAALIHRPVNTWHHDAVIDSAALLNACENEATYRYTSRKTCSTAFRFPISRLIESLDGIVVGW